MKPLEFWTCQRAENLKKMSSKIPKNNYAATMVSAARRQIIGGGEPNKKRQRRPPPHNVIGGAAGARLYPGHFSSNVLQLSHIPITAPRICLWNDLPPELRTLSLPPPPSLPITTHPPPLSVTPGPSTKNLNVNSSNSSTLIHLIIHFLHLNDTHLNSYSVPSWYSGNRT